MLEADIPSANEKWLCDQAENILNNGASVAELDQLVNAIDETLVWLGERKPKVRTMLNNYKNLIFSRQILDKFPICD